MPVDEDSLSIGALVGTPEERQRLAKRSVEFVCEQCGPIAKVAKERMMELTEENAAKGKQKQPSEFEAMLKGFAPAKEIREK
jgi:hypothetical protein